MPAPTHTRPSLAQRIAASGLQLAQLTRRAAIGHGRLWRATVNQGAGLTPEEQHRLDAVLASFEPAASETRP
jgi:hypothetical protein